MILDAEVFEREWKSLHDKNMPYTRRMLRNLYFGSYDMYKKFSTYWVDGKGAHAPNVMMEDKMFMPQNKLRTFVPIICLIVDLQIL